MKLHNVQLKKLIDEMHSLSQECKSREDVLDVARLAEGFSGPFKFDNSENWKLSGVFLLVLGILFLLTNYVVIELDWLAKIILLAKFACGMMIGYNIYLIYQRSKTIDIISDTLFQLNLFFANHINPWTDRERFVSQRLSSFAEFDRGNHSREITIEHASTETAKVPFNVYEFKYVDKEKVTKRVSDGKGGYKTVEEYVYHSYFRYGIIFKLDNFDCLHLKFNGKLAYPKINYKPASIEFNNMYELGANEEFKMSKFLKPALVEKIVNMAKDFGVFNIEINSESEVCFGFLNNIVFGKKNTESLENPRLFIESLENCGSFTRLNEFIELFENIQRYSD
ncbi:hypothetical protein [Thorsellia kenyensis]|uniref:DUF3137 domain-containing protein n=1 Tax=Thorsellia kenyensis TaxID=1549888 RepID=A0ABV6CAN1_9GAMM